MLSTWKAAVLQRQKNPNKPQESPTKKPQEQICLDRQSQLVEDGAAKGQCRVEAVRWSAGEVIVPIVLGLNSL